MNGTCHSRLHQLRAVNNKIDMVENVAGIIKTKKISHAIVKMICLFLNICCVKMPVSSAEM